MGLEQLKSDDHRIKIGNGTYATAPPLLRAHHQGNKIKIGKYCSFAEHVSVFAGGNHPLHSITTHPLNLFYNKAEFGHWSSKCPDNAEETIIENDVWLGHDSCILSNSHISNGAIIGAKSVIKGFIPPYSIVVGNPARVIGYRFKEEEIKLLNQISWWDWPEEDIKTNISLIMSSDIIRLFEVYKRVFT